MEGIVRILGIYWTVLVIDLSTGLEVLGFGIEGGSGYV